jgi:hypothetical protein
MVKIQSTIFLKSILCGIAFLMVIPTGIYAIYATQGIRNDRFFHSMMIIPITAVVMPYTVSLVFRIKYSFKTAVLSGILLGLIFTFSGKLGVIVAYYFFSSDKQLGFVALFLIEYWQMYLWMALYGMICMSIAPFFRNVLHKDLSQKPKPSPFLTKYMPSSLILRYFLNKDRFKQKNMDVKDKT